MIYDDEDNLCVIDSLVHLVALALPKEVLELSELSQSSVADVDHWKAFREFQRVVELVRVGDEPVEIHQLGVDLSKICSGFEVGEQGDPSECWWKITDWMEGHGGNMSFCEMGEESQSACSLCRKSSTSGPQPKQVVILHVGMLNRYRKYAVGELLQQEFQGETIEVDDYGCANNECRGFHRRQEIEEELQRGGGNSEDNERLKAEKYAYTGTRKTVVTGTPSVLFVVINRETQGGTKSHRHVKLQVEKIHEINGGHYSLMGIGRHYGKSKRSGHWTTLVRDGGHLSPTWYEYQKTKRTEVALGHVSSQEAAYLVFRRVEETEVPTAGGDGAGGGCM